MRHSVNSKLSVKHLSLGKAIACLRGSSSFSRRDVLLTLFLVFHAIILSICFSHVMTYINHTLNITPSWKCAVKVKAII